jgi:hypothetical protein
VNRVRHKDRHHALGECVSANAVGFILTHPSFVLFRHIIMAAEQWNVRICLAGSAPSVSTLSDDKKVAVAAGFNLRLDTRRGALQCYDTDPAAPWLSILHPEPRADAHFDLDLRNLPAGFAQASAAAAATAHKKSKKRSAEGDANGAPAAKKAKKAPVLSTEGETETPAKKKRPPSTKGRKKAPAVGADPSSRSGGGGSASQYPDELAALLGEIEPLDT